MLRDRVRRLDRRIVPPLVRQHLRVLARETPMRLRDLPGFGDFHALRPFQPAGLADSYDLSVWRR